MQIDVLTLFPEMFNGVLGESILKRAQEKKLVRIKVRDLRDWTHDKRRTVDDKPFGGGPGMVIKPEPIFEACDGLRKKKTQVLLVTPQGRPWTQPLAQELARQKRLLLICGRYEGFDERVRSLADMEISIGDYVLTGGEIPAMVIIDSVVRLVPGVLGEKDSLAFESFSAHLLEYPHYTRPRRYRGMEVPEVLLSGDHDKIMQWRRQQARQRTMERRRDLWEKYLTAPAADEHNARQTKRSARRNAKIKG
ncbi:MAG: tRNA (guanosine(37)-N1)-methyltransferase TrmD [Candidatus Omnitrophica bacterium]|nr:tRNA (guanosine(37)-N1)-methyltransferase TrmD [Candidatus Omnitrophota bacterium]